jgi:MFS family permease
MQSNTNGRAAPLIVAVSLFMENMDSTVIATSLPAIARDIGSNPLALKLAVTSYLLSLAIFIPASGWTADRFGARNVFRLAIAVFVLGSIGCALSHSLEDFVAARIFQGMGGAMMTPVGRLIVVRSINKELLLNAMSLLTIPALIGPICGPPLGGFITTYASWHWIFIINVPIGLLGIALATRFIPDVRTEYPYPFDLTGFILSGIGIGGLAFGLSVLGLEFLPNSAARRRRCFVRGLRGVCAACASADPRSQFAQAAHLSGQHFRRLHVPARDRRPPISAAAVAADWIRPDAFPVRTHHLHQRRRLDVHESRGR